MKKVLFIDRDGTLVIEPPVDYQLDSLEKLEFYPGVFQAMAKIATQLDYELVLVTNQDGLGTDSFPEDTFWPAQNKMIQAFKNEGVEFSDILIDRSFPEDNAPTRKPRTGLLQKYIYGDYDLANSYVIGDRKTDIELAKNLNCKGIFIGNEAVEGAELSTTSWAEIVSYLVSKPRVAKVVRKTNETDIAIEVNLDGTGKSSISTGIGFFDHMLEQISKHGNIDVNIAVKGDLEIDEHHTIEDVALALGEAFLKALGSKKGIERYGFLLPMDDCLAQVAIDFGGRPWLVWEAEFKREMIGEMPSEMFMHFFKSFSDTAKCNLNMKMEGDNEHHKIEALFKGFAKAIKMAVKKTDNYSIPSTKGTL
ncbi:bifunctional histidinol-phosphatase/imidazoleglycerol-phosphate dehydratase HisB [Ulvibacter litoralis]|uniref:Histidine biosynthesis bifunctional protein HisB n=1 Tax=Ulvibacter litoralis TaxID=227084 RepID=A0A1G7BVZ4_9FLAO|nr:bifunctional histidinol-phosphatase/imidazoleglycerol-phosphate dehydratase HisB [Ulvibacter litoralis]GHC49545.1 histidine biosynthesis bifunctional protein HisB [Ulvibacter litoralis]SDE31268.1 imidazoleglycerol-phosphate dehydratase / histidinol-phosphatase [Ulvibacter litoralis]